MYFIFHKVNISEQKKWSNAIYVVIGDYFALRRKLIRVSLRLPFADGRLN